MLLLPQMRRVFVQDEPEDLASQLPSVGSIYNQASVAIIASRIKSVEVSV